MCNLCTFTDLQVDVAIQVHRHMVQSGALFFARFTVLPLFPLTIPLLHFRDCYPFSGRFRFRGKRSDREETRAGACGLTGLPMRTHTYVHVSNVLQVSMCSNNVTQYRLAVNLYPTFYTIHLPLVDCHPIASFRWKKKMRFKLFA